MKISYDRVSNVMYFKLEDGKVAKTVQANDRVNIDLNVNGKAIGIELLDASSQELDLEKYVKNGVPVEITAQTPIVA